MNRSTASNSKGFPGLFFVAVVLIILFFEVILRFGFGLPGGLFKFAIQSENGLYPGNSTIEISWGAVPYTIKTNSLGLRGKEISTRKPEGKIRIAGLGDSVTDGFFVDNDDTYPAQLEEMLNKEGYNAEVINAARGGGSIDKEYTILREILIPLKPDIVLLTFVTNDIFDIKGTPRERLLFLSLRSDPERTKAAVWIITETAIGELFYDTYLRLRYKSYRSLKAKLGTDERYKINGGDNFLENARMFNVIYKLTDCLVLKDPIAEDVSILIDNYIYVLGKMNSLCHVNNIKLIFVYFPAYPQIYDTSTPLEINRILKIGCEALSIPFLDLTDMFREEGEGRVIHLTPVDYHLNPEGTRVLASGIARFLMDGDYLERQ